MGGERSHRDLLGTSVKWPLQYNFDFILKLWHK
jgi:hypothetical protein